MTTPAPTPGQAAFRVHAVLGELTWGDLDEVDRQFWEDIAQAAIKASDVADDFDFERKQVIELRDVLGEIFTCLDAGDPALLDGDQVAEWRERAGLPS